MKKLLLAASALTLVSASAFAADLAPAPAEPVVPVVAPFSWTGFYVGAQAGYAWASSDLTFRNADGSLAGRSKPDPDGGFGGGYVGYNYQFEGNFVLGLDADINGGDVKGSSRISLPGVGVAPGVNGYSKLDWFGSVRARAGYAFDRFLPYIAGGVAYGDVKSGASGATVISTKDTMVGWTVGAGLEYAFTDHIIGRIEYRYTDYGSKRDSVTNSVGTPGSLDRDFKTNDVRVGVSYKF